ncbi:MAG: endolytic transglycosylase MltG [Candidatus Berkelbacteria bacterium]|nr:endolytic transglycosylase MltG [Candidatus Berkelbacteria bacterium]
MVFLFIFIVLVFAFLFYFRQQIDKPASSSNTKEIKITDGQSSAQISDNLSSKYLINSSWSFRLYLKFKKLTIKTGDYLIPANLNEVQIAEILSKGDHQVIKITIPEGWRAEQIAAYLFDKAKIDPTEFLAKVKDLDGKLFPDTYELTDKPTADEVIAKMTDDYNARTAGLDPSDNVLSIASIVEREAANDADRAVIAGVFINRQKIDMKFESDVTVQFQKDSNNYSSVGVLNYKFWRALASGDTKTISGSYNTYLYAGIPGPICNPGLASIKATLNPATHNYYYFIYGKDGKLYLAKTQAEQQANVNKYL